MLREQIRILCFVVMRSDCSRARGVFSGVFHTLANLSPPH
jgi:hypothetical protein